VKQNTELKGSVINNSKTIVKTAKPALLAVEPSTTAAVKAAGSGPFDNYTDNTTTCLRF